MRVTPGLFFIVTLGLFFIVIPGLFFIVIPGLDPGIHLTTGTVPVSSWIAGSSPAMTNASKHSYPLS